MQTKLFEHRPLKSWTKITVTTPEFQSEIIASYLASITGLGVEQSEATSTDSPEFTVTGYLENSLQSDSALKEITAFLQQLGLQKTSISFDEIIEEDWSRNWKEHYKPSRISKRITIKPTWEEYKASADEIVIEIDPGLAFGTGLHASTRLALQLTEKVFTAGACPQKVLDVGCGTGVLGMAAALLGSPLVIAIDNDPDAVVCSKENIEQNNLTSRISASQTDINLLNDSYDLILANITADVLSQMSTQLVTLLSPNGQLILAGILQGDQADLIQKTFSRLGLTLLDSPTEEEWQSFRFSK